MRKIFNLIFMCFLFVCTFFAFDSFSVNGKTSLSNVFEIEIGNDKLPVYYNLVSSQSVVLNNEEVGSIESNMLSLNDGSSYIIKDNKVLSEDNKEVGSIIDDDILLNSGENYKILESKIKEKMLFNVILKGKEEVGKSYRWEHTFCYRIVGGNEICETDLTGKDQDGGQDILSNGTYTFSFWDGHMPYYKEDLVFEYVKFSNKFVLLEENSNEEIILDVIEFVSSEIKYTYTFDVVLNDYEGTYIGASDTAASLINAGGSSSLKLDGTPEYRFINEVCVEENNCDVFSSDKVYYSGGGSASITPYIGNINFSYSNSKFAINDTNYKNIIFRTKLVCLNNCDSRRVVGELVVFEKNYIFDYKGPVVDEENTYIDSYDEIEYIRSSETKITVEDELSGVNEETLKYYLVRPYSNSCLFGMETSYSFNNGEVFNLGEGLSGGYCMYYVVYDNVGNYYKSNYYVFYFDNNGPVLSIDNNDYDEEFYYNEVNLNVSLVDSYSGLDKSYYLWSKEEIGENDYLRVKDEGVLYDNSGVISSLNVVNSDEKYYLYILTYDKLNNYKFYDIGGFSFDVNSLQIEEVIVEVNNMNEYSSNPLIKVIVNEVSNGQEFKCGFSTSEISDVNDLSLNCKNNEYVSLPTYLEGKYSFWIYAGDKANNYSLLKVSDNLFIDTSAPVIEYSILKDNNVYNMTNEITLNVSDLNGYHSLKYGWFVKETSNVTSNELLLTFNNNDSVGYPKNVYGEYKLYVSAIDNLGNERFVSLDDIFKIDTAIINISLVGEESIIILRGQEYVEKGALAYKGDKRAADVNIEGIVNNKKSGVYYVTYSSGEGELFVSVTRKVIVKSDIPYIAIVGGLFVVGSLVLYFRLFVKKREVK